MRFQSLCRWCSKSLCVWLLKWIDTPLGCLHCTIHKGQTTSRVKSSDDLEIELDMISSCKLCDMWPICILGLHQSWKTNTTFAAFWTEGKINVPRVRNNQMETLIWLNGYLNDKKFLILILTLAGRERFSALISNLKARFYKYSLPIENARN